MQIVERPLGQSWACHKPEARHTPEREDPSRARMHIWRVTAVGAAVCAVARLNQQLSWKPYAGSSRSRQLALSHFNSNELCRRLQAGTNHPAWALTETQKREHERLSLALELRAPRAKVEAEKRRREVGKKAIARGLSGFSLLVG